MISFHNLIYYQKVYFLINGRGEAHQSMQPVISVIMGTLYRREDTALLRRAVDSILTQSFGDLELLICDDGSSAEAAALLDDTARRDPRIRLIRPGGVYPLPHKLNACLRAARGAYIARMDDDDLSRPDRLEKQLAYLRAHPEVQFVGTNVILIRNGQAVGTRTLPEKPVVRDFFMTQPYIHPTLLFRRGCLDVVGGYSEDKRQLLCEDYDLLLRLYERGFTGANLQEPLLDYTLPASAKGGRRMSHRWNEAVTRYQRFRALGLLPGALPYVVKPLAVGLLPEGILRPIKRKTTEM